MRNLRPMADRKALIGKLNANTTRANGSGSQSPRSLNRVRKNIAKAGTTSGGCESSRQPVIPPAPLTGDVGRDRGDAGRALLFLSPSDFAPPYFYPMHLEPLAVGQRPGIWPRLGTPLLNREIWS